MSEHLASALHRMVEFTREINASDAGYELEKLGAIRIWAIRQLGLDYVVGDRVVIVKNIPTNNGWRAYREALAIGQTGVVANIDFSAHHDSWHVDVVLDRAWAIGELHGETKRYWKGRAAETPEGFEPPSKYDQENYPDGKRVRFMFNVNWVRKAESS